MKFLAIIDIAPGADIEAIRAKVPDELEAAWKLYASGTLREAYLTDKPTRVVFVLEARDAEEAEETLDALPLVERGTFVVGLIELRPFTNWSRLSG